jgi:hypothetical protein
VSFIGSKGLTNYDDISWDNIGQLISFTGESDLLSILHTLVNAGYGIRSITIMDLVVMDNKVSLN